MPWDQFTSEQLQGSEYSGVSPTKNTVQPKGTDALTNGDRLRLGYLTGDETDSSNPENIEDNRQFWGLLPADKARPYWLEGTGRPSEAEIRGVGERE